MDSNLNKHTVHVARVPQCNNYRNFAFYFANHVFFVECYSYIFRNAHQFYFLRFVFNILYGSLNDIIMK